MRELEAPGVERDTVDASDESASAAIEAKFNELTSNNQQLAAKVTALEAEKTAAVKARVESLVDTAIQAGRLAPNDADAKTFWTESLLRNETMAVKALAGQKGIIQAKKV